MVFLCLAGIREICNYFKRHLLDIEGIYDFIVDDKRYADIGDSCGLNTIN